MPRYARKRSSTGIYHVMLKGIDGRDIFLDDEDKEKFIENMLKARDKGNFELYAYCLMGNHLHLLLMEGTEPLENVMRRICSSYVLWYNKKYDRVGYLFQDRFKSEPVEDDGYFLTVLRYIFQNPVKAGIVTKIKDYKWTNYTDYIEGSNKTDTDFVLDFFNTNRERAIRSFIEYINKTNDDKCLDIPGKRQLTDEDAKKIIKDHCHIYNTLDLHKFDVNKRNQYLKELKEGYGLSIRQIERLTGIGRGIIQRA